MRTGAHSPVGSAPNCRGIISTPNRHDTNAHLRPNGVLPSHSSISGRHARGQSSRGGVSHVDARSRRAARRSSSPNNACRKRQHVADAPRFNGSVLP
eukprot:3679070-Prymnesium_polylepis.1